MMKMPVIILMYMQVKLYSFVAYRPWTHCLLHFSVKMKCAPHSADMHLHAFVKIFKLVLCTEAFLLACRYSAWMDGTVYCCKLQIAYAHISVRGRGKARYEWRLFRPLMNIVNSCLRSSTDTWLCLCNRIPDAIIHMVVTLFYKFVVCLHMYVLCKCI